MIDGSLSSDLDAVIQAWQHRHAAATTARMAEVARRFVRRLEQAGVTGFGEVTGDHAHGFITAIGRGGMPPATATSRFRRTTIRAVYRELRALGQPVGDPTLDIILGTRDRSFARPLTDDEIRLCRAVASADKRGHRVSRRAVAWAFAEAGATTSEIPRISLASLDDLRVPTTVRLPGTRNLQDRTVTLTAWGRTTLAGHLAQHHYEPGDTITYRGRGGKTGSNSPLSRTCQQIVEILDAAHISREQRISPASVRHWAGRAAFNNGATLDQVAALLGLASLDTTAARIGLDWTLTRVAVEAQQ